MATILDRWVSSRRLDKRRQQETEDIMDARFGDINISAPTEGAWNQIGSGNSSFSNSWSPDLSFAKPSPERRESAERTRAADTSDKENHRHNFTITIPLPWPSRKHHTRAPSVANSRPVRSARREDVLELSPRSLMSSPEPTPHSFISTPDPNYPSSMSSPNSAWDSRATSPVVIYKPTFDENTRQFAEMARGIHRAESPPRLVERSHTVPPVHFIYKPASVDYAKEIADIGMGPSPSLTSREVFSRERATSQVTQLAVPVEKSTQTRSRSPGPRMQAVGLPADPRPIPANRTPEPRTFPNGLPAQPRVGLVRAASRGCHENQTNPKATITMIGSSSHGPYHSRSSGHLRDLTYRGATPVPRPHHRDSYSSNSSASSDSNNSFSAPTRPTIQTSSSTPNPYAAKEHHFGAYEIEYSDHDYNRFQQHNRNNSTTSSTSSTANSNNNINSKSNVKVVKSKPKKPSWHKHQQQQDHQEDKRAKRKKNVPGPQELVSDESEIW